MWTYSCHRPKFLWNVKLKFRFTKMSKDRLQLEKYGFFVHILRFTFVKLVQYPISQSWKQKNFLIRTSFIQTLKPLKPKYLERCKVAELQNSYSKWLQRSSNPHNHIGVDRPAVRIKILWLELRCTHGVLSQGTWQFRWDWLDSLLPILSIDCTQQSANH